MRTGTRMHAHMRMHIHTMIHTRSHMPMRAHVVVRCCQNDEHRDTRICTHTHANSCIVVVKKVRRCEHDELQIATTFTTATTAPALSTAITTVTAAIPGTYTGATAALCFPLEDRKLTSTS